MHPHELSRRSFLSLAASFPMGGTIAPVSLTAQPRELESGDPAISTFLDPGLSCRPMTRWWWFGGAVTEKELTRELELMQSAGIGGVEIQPVYPVASDDPEKGIIHIPFFSSRWYQLLAHTLREGQRLGLRVDMTLGSGWPFGGPFVELDQAARRIRLISRGWINPGAITWDIGSELGEGERIASVTWHPVDEKGNVDPSPKAAILCPAAELRERIAYATLPAGHWRGVAVVDAPTYMTVKRPTLGMEGYVLDHFSKTSLELFLKATGERTIRELTKLNAPLPQSWFCDSLEVFGADWTPRFLEEFAGRRGYRIEPFIPALLDSSSPFAEKVRFDYHKTLSELSIDQFFRPLADWCHRSGIPSRVQAHGTMGDILTAYGTVDVPEGETIFGGDLFDVNIPHRRLASSAGHLYSKRVISAEAYTWLRTPMFMVNLEMMKAATDALFLDGINQIVNHGYAYSPPEAGSPGWNFYASTEINHNNLWWNEYPHLAKYVQRCCALLQLGSPVNRIAVYLPQADVLSSRGIGGFHLDVAIREALGTELVNALRQSGYDFDFVNDEALLLHTQINDGSLETGSGRYQALVLPPIRLIEPAVLKAIQAFASNGGLVVFLERTPEAAPGLADHASRDASVQILVGEILSLAGSRKPIVTPAVSALISRLDEALGPDFRLVAGHPSESDPVSSSVGFVRRRVGVGDLYFLANVSEHPRNLIADFLTGHQVPLRLDPLTGAQEKHLVFDHLTDPQGRARTRVEFSLDAFESCFLRFAPGGPPAVRSGSLPRSVHIEVGTDRVTLAGVLGTPFRTTIVTGDGAEVELSGPTIPESKVLAGTWRLSAKGVVIPIDRLCSWNALNGPFRDFSGVVEYRIDFSLTPDEARVFGILDLGQVHETARVELNGRLLGSTWKRPHRLNCGEALREGQNTLSLAVANLWIHHVNATGAKIDPDLALGWGIRWGRYGEVPPQALPPSGLLGPVKLIPQVPYRQTILPVAQAGTSPDSAGLLSSA